MKADLTALLRLKVFRAERALRLVQAKTRDLRMAESVEDQALRRMQASAESLPRREAHVYDSILRRAVGVPEIDDVKGRIKSIETQHMKLVDSHQRSKHVLAKVAAELDAAAKAERQARQAVDKYTVLMDDLRRDLETRKAQTEAEDIDEMFSLRRRRGS